MWNVGCLFFSSFLFAAVSADDHGADAISYTAETFPEEIEKTKHFVMFFAPWCGHCKRLAPTWNELAKIYNEKDEKEVIVAKVDCTLETSVCAENDVTGYPTLKFFASGKDGAVRYKGPRDLNALQTFIEEQLGKKPEPVQEEVAKAPEGPVYELNADNFETFTQTGNHFIKFYAPWCGHCKRMAPTWEELAQQYKGDDSVSISKVDCTQNQQLCSNHGVRGYPTLLFFKDGQKVDQYSGQREVESFKTYIAEKTGRRGGEEQEEEEEEEEEKEEMKVAVFELNADNFNDAIEEGVTFVKFYAPWCGHCKRLAPTWDDLSQNYAEIHSVKIAKVDCTQHRSLCQDNKVKGYPTLIMFKDGEMKEEYNGGRDLEKLVQFVDKFVFTGDLKEEPRDEL